MQESNGLQNWVSSLGTRRYSALVGILIGLAAGIIAIMMTVAGPVITFAAVIGLLAGLYILSNVRSALYGVIIIAALLPFGTVPFKIAVTPTLLDVAVGAFVLVYLFQWMTGNRQQFRLSPVHPLIILYMMWLLLAFALGLRYAPPTSAILRQFAETLISISMVFILVDLVRDPTELRRLVVLAMMVIGIQALVVIVLYVLPDTTAENLLVRLARIGYPNGGVIRYIEDNPANAERAIGTWVDPNALGGILAVSAAMIAPQVFAERPVIKQRWAIIGVLGVIGFALLLTYSRASMLAFAISLFFTGLFPRYRKYIGLLVLGGCLILILPQTRGYIQRFSEAFTATDLATQMRLGEYGDSLNLIQQNPIVGVGFTGTPSITLYTNVASLYLIMANQIGLVGVAIFLTMIASVFLYGWHARQKSRDNPTLEAVHLGYHAALLAALINATADLYFFRLDFQASITTFWMVVALAVTSSKLALMSDESTVAKTG